MSFPLSSRELHTAPPSNHTMKHPFHIVLSSEDGELLFTANQNQIQVFQTATGRRVGHWIDDIDTTESIKEKVKKEQERQLEENKKEGKEPSKKKRKSNNAEAKVPTPGAGAPKVYNYVRALHLTKGETHLIAATDSDKAGVIFEINKENDSNILTMIKRQAFPKRPSAITSSTTGSDFLIADKFGDVYAVPINSDASRVINSETDPILGHVSMLTDITIATHEGQQYVITCDRDEHIRISKYPQGFIIKNFLFGHTQFVNTIAIPQLQPTTLVSAGGDDYMLSWNWVEGKQLDKFNVREIIEPYMDEFHFAPSKFQNENGDLREICVSQVVPLAETKQLAVLVEATKCILILNLSDEGKLSLDKIIELPNKVVSITATKTQIIASLDSREDKLVQVIDIKSQQPVEVEGICTISQNSTVEIASEEDLFPLFTVYQLRKRSEH